MNPELKINVSVFIFLILSPKKSFGPAALKVKPFTFITPSLSLIHRNTSTKTLTFFFLIKSIGDKLY